MLPATLFTVILGIVFFIAEYYLAVRWLHPLWWLMLLFCWAMSALLHRLLSLPGADDPARRVTYYMTATVARLVLALMLVGVVLYRGTAQVGVFIANFLMLYISYAGFEIWVSGRNLRRDS